jgi:hypothetical protein
MFARYLFGTILVAFCCGGMDPHTTTNGPKQAKNREDYCPEILLYEIDGVFYHQCFTCPPDPFLRLIVGAMRPHEVDDNCSGGMPPTDPCNDPISGSYGGKTGVKGDNVPRLKEGLWHSHVGRQRYLPCRGQKKNGDELLPGKCDDKPTGRVHGFSFEYVDVGGNKKWGQVKIDKDLEVEVIDVHDLVAGTKTYYFRVFKISWIYKGQTFTSWVGQETDPRNLGEQKRRKQSPHKDQVKGKFVDPSEGPPNLGSKQLIKIITGVHKDDEYHVDMVGDGRD